MQREALIGPRGTAPGREQYKGRHHRLHKRNQATALEATNAPWALLDVPQAASHVQLILDNGRLGGDSADMSQTDMSIGRKSEEGLPPFTYGVLLCLFLTPNAFPLIALRVHRKSRVTPAVAAADMKTDVSVRCPRARLLARLVVPHHSHAPSIAAMFWALLHSISSAAVNRHQRHATDHAFPWTTCWPRALFNANFLAGFLRRCRLSATPASC